MDIQRMRSLTTGVLHTEVSHVYADIEALTGAPGVMTHQIPGAIRAMRPWLIEKIATARFWDGRFDQSHVGNIELAPMSADEAKAFFARYIQLGGGTVTLEELQAAAMEKPAVADGE